MHKIVARVGIRYEEDVVYARQRARLIAEMLGLDRNDQTRVSTAVSEIARLVHTSCREGDVEFALAGDALPSRFEISVSSSLPLGEDLSLNKDGWQVSLPALKAGISGAQRLMDYLQVQKEAERITIRFGKNIDSAATTRTPFSAERIMGVLADAKLDSPLEEIRWQNQELMLALAELREKQKELLNLNRELEDTNRGVLALYAELDEKARQLKRVNDSKNSFLSHISHELRTPLNSILALARLLLERSDGELTIEQEKQVTYIYKAAENMTNLINDLLDLAKIEAGKIEVQPKECTVSEIFRSLRGMLRPLLTREELNLVFLEEPELPPLYIDEGKVSQILRNLISNAIKFTERGEIRVTAKRGGASQTILFTIADTGIGIPPEDQERIFEDYVQLNHTLAVPVKGSGLGLPIAKKTAEMLGGQISVESTPGKGSTFSVVLPVYYGLSQASGEEQAETSGAQRKIPVLIVEDDLVSQMLYAKYLEGSSFQIIQAQNLAAARQVLKEMRPQVIVLDILLPDGEAWSFLNELKETEATWDIPVVIVSVLEEQDRGLALEADDYAVKPLDPGWLLARLRELVQERKQAKILTIDDDEVFRYIIKGYLTETPYQIIEAGDGTTGLELAETEKPDVIILDLVMPRMSGFTVLKYLKENPRTQHIPVIILSSKILDDEERRYLQEQVRAVVSKETLSREGAIRELSRVLQQAIRKHDWKVV